MAVNNGLQLRCSLGTFGALSLSIALIGPTMAMAFNVKLAAKVAGQAAPLAFLMGGAAIALVGLSLVSFARTISSTGSVAAYIASVFGLRLGFLAGWTMALTYFVFATLTLALAGAFGVAALAHFGLRLPGLWLAIGTTMGALIIVLGGREIRLLTSLMLVIEGAAILAVLLLAAVILSRVPWSMAPFVPRPDQGFSGVGYAMTFAILSFAGFEGSATVAEETRDPRRAIPWSLLGSVAVVGVSYVVVSYAQVLGFGPAGIADLAGSEAPLDALATRFVSDGFGAALDGLSAVSAVGCALSATSAGARILFALGRAGLDRGLKLDTLDERYGTPRRAATIVSCSSLFGLVAVASWVGPEVYADAASTIGGIAAVAVYIVVGMAQAVMAKREGRRLWATVGVTGSVVLTWPLFTSLYPLPPWPGVVWPLAVLAWLVAGAGYSALPGFCQRARDESASLTV